MKQINLLRWEDDAWDNVNLDIQTQKIGRQCTYTSVIPFHKMGTFKVHIECEGFMAVKDEVQGGGEKKWKGLLAYDERCKRWGVKGWSGARITKLQEASRYLKGDPDNELNGCKFNSQGVELDYTCNFDIEITDPNQAIGLIFPTINNDSTYNFVVSYGGYTWKTAEFGTISLVIDEIAPPGHQPEFTRVLALIKKYSNLMLMACLRRGMVHDNAVSPVPDPDFPRSAPNSPGLERAKIDGLEDLLLP
jgi:hypothetical protein